MWTGIQLPRPAVQIGMADLGILQLLKHNHPFSHRGSHIKVPVWRIESYEQDIKFSRCPVKVTTMAGVLADPVRFMVALWTIMVSFTDGENLQNEPKLCKLL